MSSEMNLSDSKAYDGVAYGRPQQTSDDDMVRVGPGTPCGELLRRYWHPVGLSSEATSTPRKVRVLGEDLILFRDGKGKPGLLYPRCMHRGTTLYYGRVEDRGIRCCYHGWLFDVEGNCLEQPCERGGGVRTGSVRQPWYPVQERYGLVFAYLGPPERMPLLPRYDILEDLAPGEAVYTKGGAGLAFGDVDMPIETVPYNWLQDWENIVDPYHVWILHSNISEVQFAEGFKVMPRVDFDDHPYGIIYHAHRDLDDGQKLIRSSVAIFPYVAAVPSIELEAGPSKTIFWFRPVDDTNFLLYMAEVATEEPLPLTIPMTPDGRTWSQMSEEEHQKFPGDFEAQWGQGEITLHSEEHLVRSDTGVVKLRRKLLEQIKIVQKGGDPICTAFEPGTETIKIPSGNFFS